MAQHNDPLSGARYPDLNSATNPPQDIQNAVSDLSSQVIPRFATASARTTAYANWVAAGNTMVSGLKSFTQNDGRYWRYDTASSSWLYAGGNPPPIVAVTAGTGWSITARAPGCYRDSSGIIHLVGAVYPTSTYNPQDGTTHTAFQIPTGYRPGANVESVVPVPSPVLTTVLVEIRTDGIGYIIAGNTSSIPSGTASPHFLEGISFNPSYAGLTPVA